MLFNTRVIIDNDGTLTDISRTVSDIGGQAEGFDTPDPSFIYIGSDLPFTHRYFKLGSTVNEESADIAAVSIWDGKSWVPAVDVHDGTADGDTTFAQSGVLSWVTNRNSSWACEATTEDMAGSGLESLKIYGMYWIKIQFSAAMTNGVELQWVGHCFGDDNYMRMHYPDLMVPAVLTAFQAGKTTWEDQHCLAAQEVIRFLQRKRQIWTPNQLQNWQQFSIAATHKAAEIAYSGFPGDDQEDMRKRAESKFYQAMNQNVVAIDKNENGHVEQRERRPTAGWFRR